MSSKIEKFSSKKWSYPLLYVLLFFLNTVFPPYASKGYSWGETGQVIYSLLRVSLKPYVHLAPIFHIATLILIILIWKYGKRASRIFSAYVGVNYVFIALGQGIGTTEKYGLVILTGGVVSYLLIALLWCWESFNPKTDTTFTRLPLIRYWTVPLAFLAFWSPIRAIPLKGAVLDFNPRLLLTSYGYGLSFCMTTPVILCLLTLFYPNINKPLLKVNSFVGIIYGLWNMLSLLDPQTRWSGILHFPLLLISIYAFVLPNILKANQASLEERVKT
jgi:hypothetical protein